MAAAAPPVVGSRLGGSSCMAMLTSVRAACAPPATRASAAAAISVFSIFISFLPACVGSRIIKASIRAGVNLDSARFPSAQQRIEPDSHHLGRLDHVLDADPFVGTVGEVEDSRAVGNAV